MTEDEEAGHRARALLVVLTVLTACCVVLAVCCAVLAYQITRRNAQLDSVDRLVTEVRDETIRIGDIADDFAAEDPAAAEALARVFRMIEEIHRQVVLTTQEAAKT